MNSGSLGEFYSLLVVDWTCYRLVTVMWAAYGEDYELELCEEMCFQVWQDVEFVKSQSCKIGLQNEALLGKICLS